MKKIILILVGSITTVSANAGNWSLGGGALISANPYQSMKTNILPIPFASYQGEHFVIYGPIAKLRLPLDKTNILGMTSSLIAGLTYEIGLSNIFSVNSDLS